MNILELLIHCRLHAAPSAAPLWPADGSQRVHGNDGRPRPDGSVDGRTAVPATTISRENLDASTEEETAFVR